MKPTKWELMHNIACAKADSMFTINLTTIDIGSLSYYKWLSLYDQSMQEQNNQLFNRK